MYYYIVDPQKISQREFERVQNVLYSSLSEYRVAGEVARVTGLRTITQLVETAISRGVKTLVAVGTDETLTDVVNAAKGRDVVIGFIPLGETELGELLGIRGIEQGAKIIGQRRIEQMDLGMVNKNYFISKLTFGLPAETGGGWFDYKFAQAIASLPEISLEFKANDKYTAYTSAIGGYIINSRHPVHGTLDLVLLGKLTRMQAFQYRKEIKEGRLEKIPGSSVLHIKSGQISSPSGLVLRAQSKVVARTPATIEIQPQALKIIVGRDRKF